MSFLQMIARGPTLWVMLGMMAFCFAVSLAVTAFAAPSAKIETPLSATQSRKDAIQAKPRCLQATTVQRFSVKPDGKMEYIGGFTMWTPCQSK